MMELPEQDQVFIELGFKYNEVDTPTLNGAIAAYSHVHETLAVLHADLERYMGDGGHVSSDAIEIFNDICTVIQKYHAVALSALRMRTDSGLTEEEE